MCGGDVTVHEMWASVTPDIPRCQQCGATAKKQEAKVIPMERTTVGVTRRDAMTYRPAHCREAFTEQGEVFLPDMDASSPYPAFVIDLDDEKLILMIREWQVDLEQRLTKAIDDMFEKGSGATSTETK